jgi:hypothetical protein
MPHLFMGLQNTLRNLSKLSSLLSTVPLKIEVFVAPGDQANSLLWIDFAHELASKEKRDLQL